MKRFMVAVIAVVFVFVTGVSYGQYPPQMPEKVRNTLGKLIGTWSVSTEPVSKVTFRWAPGKYYVIMNGEFETEAGRLTSSGLMSWDGVSEDKMIMSLVDPAGYNIEHIRIVSETVSEGEATGSMLGKKDSSKSKYVFQGPGKFTSYTTNEIVGGERQPDSTTVFTRVKDTSDEKVLVDLSDQWCKALLNQDAGTLDRILSDDFILSNPDAVKTKNEIVDSIKSGDLVVTLCDYRDAAIRIYGDVAIIQGVGKESGRYKGENYSGSNRFTDVFLKREDQWQCIATHISKKATNENSIVSNPSPEMKKLEGLVGTWAYEGEQVDPPVDGLPYGPAGKFSGTFTNRFVLDGFFVERKLDENNPAGRMTAIEIIGYDPKENVYTQNLYLSEGNISVSTATLDGRTWTSNSTMTTKTGEKVLVKAVVKYASDWNSFTASVDLSPDNGKTWKFWFKDEGRKVKK